MGSAEEIIKGSENVTTMLESRDMSDDSSKVGLGSADCFKFHYFYDHTDSKVVIM